MWFGFFGFCLLGLGPIYWDLKQGTFNTKTREYANTGEGGGGVKMKILWTIFSQQIGTGFRPHTPSLEAVGPEVPGGLLRASSLDPR